MWEVLDGQPRPLQAAHVQGEESQAEDEGGHQGLGGGAVTSNGDLEFSSLFQFNQLFLLGFKGFYKLRTKQIKTTA